MNGCSAWSIRPAPEIVADPARDEFGELQLLRRREFPPQEAVVLPAAFDGFADDRGLFAPQDAEERIEFGDREGFLVIVEQRIEQMSGRAVERRLAAFEFKEPFEMRGEHGELLLLARFQPCAEGGGAGRAELTDQRGRDQALPVVVAFRPAEQRLFE